MTENRIAVRFSREGILLAEMNIAGPLELGRQQAGEPGPFELVTTGDIRRIIIAHATERAYPRRLLRIRTIGSTLELENVHNRVAIDVRDFGMLEPGASMSVPGEALIRLSTSLDVTVSADIKASNEGSRRAATWLATGDSPLVSLTQLINDPTAASRGGAAFIDLLQLVLHVVQLPAGSQAFFDAAAKATAEAVELDRAMVMLRSNDSWNVVTEYVRGSQANLPDRPGKFSSKLLERMLKKQTTEVFQSMPAMAENPELGSLLNLERGVASPIFDDQHKLIGAICGDRRGNGGSGRGISDVEAMLVEVIAGAVAAGMARRREEENRVRLQQFFTSRLADQLQANPSLLDGHDAEVTVLFCDIRGFSTTTERLGPRKTIDWINDVLTELSDCVLRHEGVLVDYVGDELMAMWGAPGSQPDHARRAMLAATEMLNLVEPLRQRWSEVLEGQFGFGIGMSSGPARVGNTGSRLKFKYGPLGNTVNLGSRVQGVTKQLRVAALGTESTVSSAGNDFATRRLGSYRVVGIDRVVELFELSVDGSDSYQRLREAFEEALSRYEAGELSDAAHQLAALLKQFPEDGPTLLLLGRAVQQLAHPTSKFDPTWTFQEK